MLPRRVRDDLTLRKQAPIRLGKESVFDIQVSDERVLHPEERDQDCK